MTVHKNNLSGNRTDGGCEGRFLTGFTLIELIVVIAIVAILVTIVVVAINPAEQIARSRDTKRTSDLDALRSAWNLYIAQATGTVTLADRTNRTCKDASASTKTLFIATSVGTSTPPGGGFDFVATSTNQFVATTTQPEVGGSWAPGRIDQTPGGKPIAALPADPMGMGHAGYFYSYACDQSKRTYEFTARLESAYYTSDLDVDGLDGGNSTHYEVGTDLTLIPPNY